MAELLGAVASWPSLLLIVFLFGFAPGFCLRLIVLAYPRGDPRRTELVAELYVVPRIERPLWVGEQLEVAIFEGLPHRLSSARQRRFLIEFGIGFAGRLVGGLGLVLVGGLGLALVGGLGLALGGRLGDELVGVFGDRIGLGIVIGCVSVIVITTVFMLVITIRFVEETVRAYQLRYSRPSGEPR